MINSVINRNNYIGNDATATYPYSFKVYTKNDLKVVVREIATGVETVLVVDTDYTVSGLLSVTGGNVVLVDSAQAWLTGGFLKDEYAISIRRIRSLKQLADVKNQGDFFPETHEDVFDKQVMISQQQQDEIDRSIKLLESISPTVFDMHLPAEFVGAEYATIMTNADGDGWEKGPTASEVSNAQTYAINAQTSADEAAASAASVVAPQITGSRAVPEDIVAGTGIAFSGTPVFHTWYVQGSGGAVTISANPSIAPGVAVGQRLRLIGRSDTNTLTINTGNGVDLNGDSVTLLASSVIDFEYDGTNWLETSRR